MTRFSERWAALRVLEIRWLMLIRRVRSIRRNLYWKMGLPRRFVRGFLHKWRMGRAERIISGLINKADRL